MSRLDIRMFLYSYWGLLYISLFVFNHPYIQLFMTACWLLTAAAAVRHAAVAGCSAQRLLRVAVYSQLPGLLSSTLGLVAALAGTPSEVADGALELWTHPFFPLLEQLPQQSVGGMSVAFVGACLIPLLSAGLPVVLGTWRLNDGMGRRKLVTGWLTKRQKV